MEQTETITTAWLNSTNNIMNDWRNMAERWNTDQTSIWNSISKLQQQWANTNQSMFANMGTAIPAGAYNPFSHQTTRDAFNNMLKSTDVYKRLFQ